MKQGDTNKSSGPWWREGFMWLVVGGPSVVVVASFVTLFLALHFPEQVLEEKTPAQEREASEQAANKAASMAPALKARNHAATGGN
ncbi:nitrogen fixation protein FixH [Roseateles koreensis]|uniref:Nitrogen fixation protein FixH n=1 Tax=Roseateles koreensis TaxID=2987526 RepID=A0ABT5KPW5_9BURK|nr:nitrogen fixation protein FixH [Roseateles koreensis]MDC8783891.1 nitrogen fixation protein FixH [Roseateles koreensis]